MRDNKDVYIIWELFLDSVWGTLPVSEVFADYFEELSEGGDYETSINLLEELSLDY